MRCIGEENKVRVGKSKVMVLKGLKCEVYIDRIHLEAFSEFKYLGCVLDESDTDEAVSGRWRLGGGLQVPLGP